VEHLTAMEGEGSPRKEECMEEVGKGIEMGEERKRMLDRRIERSEC